MRRMANITKVSSVRSRLNAPVFANHASDAVLPTASRCDPTCTRQASALLRRSHTVRYNTGWRTTPVYDFGQPTAALRPTSTRDGPELTPRKLPRHPAGPRVHHVNRDARDALLGKVLQQPLKSQFFPLPVRGGHVGASGAVGPRRTSLALGSVGHRVLSSRLTSRARGDTEKRQITARLICFVPCTTRLHVAWGQINTATSKREGGRRCATTGLVQFPPPDRPRNCALETTFKRSDPKQSPSASVF